jgi:hypothetical protein
VDNVDIKSILSIFTFLAGVGSGVWGMLKWFSDSERKKFAAEREFVHLRNSQEQMKESLKMLSRELDELSDDMKTQSACFQLILSNSGQTMSGLFAPKPKRGDGEYDSH